MERLKNTMDPSEFLREFRTACATPVMLLRQTAQAMAIEMQEGLDHPGQRRLKMLPTYLECLPLGCVFLLIFPCF
jgi:hexokinase